MLSTSASASWSDSWDAPTTAVTAVDIMLHVTVTIAGEGIATTKMLDQKGAVRVARAFHPIHRTEAGRGSLR